jgi:hypothetical protein
MTLSNHAVDWNRRGQPPPSLSPVVIISIVFVFVVLKEDWYPTSFSCHVEDASPKFDSTDVRLGQILAEKLSQSFSVL